MRPLNPCGSGAQSRGYIRTLTAGCRSTDVTQPAGVPGRQPPAAPAPSGESAGAPTATPATGLLDARPVLTRNGSNSVARRPNSVWAGNLLMCSSKFIQGPHNGWQAA